MLVLRDLQYLVAVADHLHFGKAAQACHVSQPTLSMQLRKLEDRLKLPLFERNNRHVRLTTAGEVMIARARSLLEQAKEMEDLAKVMRDPLAGDLSLGLFPTLAPYLLPHIMPTLRMRLPKLRLFLHEERSPTLLKRLQEGSLDAVLLALPVEEQGIQATKLFEEPFLLAVSAQHPLAKRKQVSLNTIAKETILLLEEGHCLRDQALEVCQQIGVGESSHFRATSMATLLQMVSSGSYVTLVPEMATKVKDAALRYLPISPNPPKRQIALCTRRTSPRKALWEALAEAIPPTLQDPNS